MEQINTSGVPQARVEMKEAKLVKNISDSVFTTLFSTQESLLDLHRTLHPKEASVTKRSIIPVALEHVLTNDLYNDVAYLVGDRLIILVEHQSTINQNMPLRMLIYLAREYERIVYGGENSGKIYNETLIKIPQPEFYVVYTGEKSWDTSMLRLRDAFPNPKTSPLDLDVEIIHRTNTLKKSSQLNGYFEFIHRVQTFLGTGLPKREAFVAAIDSCVADGILVEFLSIRREEIVTMLTKEFDLMEYGNVKAEEGRKQGREEGKLETAKETALKMLNDGMSATKVLKYVEVSPDVLKKWQLEQRQNERE